MHAMLYAKIWRPPTHLRLSGLNARTKIIKNQIEKISKEKKMIRNHRATVYQKHKSLQSRKTHVWGLKPTQRLKVKEVNQERLGLFAFLKHDKMTKLSLKTRFIYLMSRGFLGIIKLTKRKFSVLINIKYNLKNKISWRMNLSHSTLFKRCMQQIMTVKDNHHWGGWNRLGKLSFPRRRVWLTDLWFGTDNLFIFPFFSIFF